MIKFALPCCFSVEGGKGISISERNSAGATHILLAEDFPEFANRLLAILKPLPVSVTFVSDGMQAIRYVDDTERPLNLLITDLTMPRRTGWHVISRVRQYRGTGVPIIMQTGEASDPWVIEQAVELGIVLIDKKDIDLQLLPAVKDALAIP